MSGFASSRPSRLIFTLIRAMFALISPLRTGWLRPGNFARRTFPVRRARLNSSNCELNPLCLVILSSVRPRRSRQRADRALTALQVLRNPELFNHALDRHSVIDYSRALENRNLPACLLEQWCGTARLRGLPASQPDDVVRWNGIDVSVSNRPLLCHKSSSSALPALSESSSGRRRSRRRRHGTQRVPNRYCLPVDRVGRRATRPNYECRLCK